MVVGQAYRRRLTGRVDCTGGAGVTSGQPLLPMRYPRVLVAVELDGSASSLFTALRGLALWWEENSSCIGFPQPSKETTGIVDLWCWCLW